MKSIAILLATLAWIPAANAAYTETMDPNGVTKNLQADFGLVDDNAGSNQSDRLQKAIDTVSADGGGRLLLPRGTYRFAGITMKSNVHLLIEKDTVIKPYWPEGSKTVIFSLNGDRGHIENVSIRGVGGKFIVDYSDRGSVPGEGIRTINCRQVKNFLISDIFVKDSFTTYCAVIFTPGKGEDAKSGGVFRPTDGLVKNLKSTDSSPGYGLVQMHAGETIHFENLEAFGGGVTFRLETGAGGHNGGVHDITAKNIYCENGSTAVLLGPHKAQNGVVKIDGVTVKSCAFAVTMGPGYVEERNKGDETYKPGIFADGTTVKNVHAIFGTNAAISLKGLVNVPKEYLKDLRFDENDRKMKRVRGPSVGVVRDSTEGCWNPIIENVTSEGFKYNEGVTKGSKGDRINWRDALQGTPLLEQLEQNMSKTEETTDSGTKVKKRSGKNRKQPTESPAFWDPTHKEQVESTGTYRITCPGLPANLWNSVAVPLGNQPIESTKTSLTYRYGSNKEDVKKAKGKQQKEEAGRLRNFEGEPVVFTVCAPAEIEPGEPLGLLVYISPHQADLDVDFGHRFNYAVDERRMVTIVANRAGNHDSTAWRVMCAVAAVELAKRRYNIQSERVYVSGASGGGRVTSYVMLRFPEIFTGAMPICGMYPLSVWEPANIPPETLSRFYSSTRLAVLEGKADFNREESKEIFDFYEPKMAMATYIEDPNAGHGVHDPKYLDEALDFLDRPLSINEP